MSDRVKLNPAIKSSWLTALTSGKYFQTDSCLVQFEHGRQEHCCLGVLANLRPVRGKFNITKKYKDTPNKAGSKRIPSHFEFDGVSAPSGYLPNKMFKQIGLTAGTQRTLARMNDDGKPFEDIAKWIDTNL